MTQRKFARRTFLPNIQTCIWKIESGVVRTLTWLEDGTAIGLGLWGIGDIVGAMPHINAHQIECLSNVIVSGLPQDYWEQNPQALFTHIQQTQELLVIRSHRRAETMIAELLSWIAKKFGQQSDAGQVLDLHMTHQDIAEMVGSTRVTVTRILSQFEQQGLILRVSKRRIVLSEVDFWHYEI